MSVPIETNFVDYLRKLLNYAEAHHRGSALAQPLEVLVVRAKRAKRRIGEPKKPGDPTLLGQLLLVFSDEAIENMKSDAPDEFFIVRVERRVADRMESPIQIARPS